MMLFPLGGGKGDELSAHYYTLNLHNPAVVKGVMQDAFDYMKKYHDITISSFLPRIHVQPDLQTQITRAVSGKKHKLDPTWSSYVDLVQRKQAKNERRRLRLPVSKPGNKFLTLVICKQERAYARCVCACVCVCVCVWDCCDHVFVAESLRAWSRFPQILK